MLALFFVIILLKNAAHFKCILTLKDTLHTTFAKYVHQDPTIQSLAKFQKTGHLNINDGRTTTLFGRVSDPEDIWGTVLLKEGMVVPGTYER